MAQLNALIEAFFAWLLTLNVFIIAGIIGLFTIVLGAVLAALFAALSRLVTQTQAEQEAERTAYSPAQTFGFEVPVNADVPVQLERARKLAATRAAALPRGANMRIGRLGEATLKTASEGLEEDPWTAVKIAAFHTWQGAKTGPPQGGAPQEAATVARAAAPPTKKPSDLVPGKDYPYTEITDDMSGEEKRRLRIANVKARAEAVKALKQQGAAPTAGESGEPVLAAAEKAAPAAADGAAAAGVPEPDYIEITDDMEPDEVRKARIHNSRARSAYHKALKDAGIDPKTLTADPSAAPAATEASPKAATPAEPTPATGREAVAVPDNIPEPDYIEITDDMEPDEVRKARVQNSRERSRYYKALKDAGLDPKEVEAAREAAASAPTQQAAPQGQAAAAPEPAAEPAPAGNGAAEIPADIPRPDYIEITDDMEPDEVRQARVHNSKERSAFFKALKAAGIDPKTVDI